MTQDFPFITDILSQPEGVKNAVDGYDPQSMRELSERLHRREFDRIIVTGMGSSGFASYAAWVRLAQAGMPAIWLDASELNTYASALITPQTILWMISNSGKIIEMTRILNRRQELGSPFILANTNYEESPLGQAADLIVPIHTGNDITLATRSYLGTLAVTQLMALNLAGKTVEKEVEDLYYTGEGLDNYLKDLDWHIENLDQAIGEVKQLAILGRGASYATALEGALCFKEGPKLYVEGQTTGQFWHGMVELANPDFSLLMMAGEEATQKEDEFLAAKAARLGMKVFWFSNTISEQVPTIMLPKNRGIGLTLAEIVPIQLISINVGKQTGHRPGDFVHLTHTVNTKVEEFKG